MNNFKYIKPGLLATVLCAVTAIFTACEDNIDVGSNDSNRYNNIEDVYGYVRNALTAHEPSTLTLFGDGTASAQVYFELSKVATGAVSVQLKMDKSVLDAYNAANGTSYEMYPAASVIFANNGTATVVANETKSKVVDITVSSGGTVGKTYALPVTAEVSSQNVTLSKNNESYIFLVKPYAKIPDSDKGTGIKSIVYIEVNDENILNVGEYTMKSSGKPFFDVVNIFAANINYNSETGRVYVNCNENVSYVLRNADQLIRPLQAKGIKVVLTILGNHDEAGVANLSPEAAADFARELKHYVDIYGLDGVDFDDEYSKYVSSNPSPGLEIPSRSASARLVYECRKLMPDKIISFYDFNNYVPSGIVEGIQVGNLLNYSYWGAYANWDNRRYVGITGFEKSQYGPSSFNLDYSAGRSGYKLSDVERVRSEKWGIQMFYNLKPQTYDYSTAFNKIGNILFDDDVEWSGRVYERNDVVGKVNMPTYESYLGTWTLTPAKGAYWYAAARRWIETAGTPFTLRIEENVVNESYNVYGWGGNGDDLPLIMNYTPYGRVEINLPQTVTDANGKSWQYIPRYNDWFDLYPSPYSRVANFTIDPVEPAFSGVIDSNGTFTIKGLRLDFGYLIKIMSPVQYNSARRQIVDIKGGLMQDIAYEPFTLSR